MILDAALIALYCSVLMVLVSAASLLTSNRTVTPIVWPKTWAEYVEEGHQPPPTRAVAPKARRHSTRCGSCGRFAKLHDTGVADGDPWWSTECSKCGYQVQSLGATLVRRYEGKRSATNTRPIPTTPLGDTQPSPIQSTVLTEERSTRWQGGQATAVFDLSPERAAWFATWAPPGLRGAPNGSLALPTLSQERA